MRKPPVALVVVLTLLTLPAPALAGGPPAYTVGVSCSPSSLAPGATTSCTATVSTAPGNPTATGTVTFSSTGGSGAFSPNPCTLSSGGCSSAYTPTTAGRHTVTATWNGYSGSTTVTVSSAPSSAPVVDPRPPTVTAVSPASAGAGRSVVLSGTGFDTARQVLFGEVAAAFVVDGYERITAAVPSGSGTVDVQVVNANGTSAVNPGDRFTYASAPGKQSPQPQPQPGPSSSGPPQPEVVCARVPTLVRHTLAYVRRVLARDGCRAPLTVMGHRPKHGLAHVVSQTPVAGTAILAGGGVTVTIG